MFLDGFLLHVLQHTAKRKYVVSSPRHLVAHRWQHWRPGTQDCERALLLLRNIDPAEAPLAYGSGDEHHDGDLDEQELSERTAGEPNGARPPRQARGQQQEGAQEEGEGAGRRARRRVARRSAAGAGQGQGMLDAAGDPLLLPVDEDEMLLAGGYGGRESGGVWRDWADGVATGAMRLAPPPDGLDQA